MLDAALFSLMPSLHPSLAQLAGLLMAHAAACLLFSLALVRLLPAPLRSPAFQANLFVFMSVVFIPVLGMVGFLVCIVPALRLQGLTARSSGWQHSHIPGLPRQPAEPGGSSSFSRGRDLAGPLQHATDPVKRIKALIATLSLEAQDAVPLLRLALKDPDDEVRLLAYALLNRKEKVIEALMRKHQALPADNGSEQVFLQHKALANDYWELAHMGELHGEARISLCGRAHEHVQVALQLRPQDGCLQFLSGQILLIRMELDAASDAFDKAQKSGIDARQIALMHAEISFHRQHYAEVRHHLTQVGSGGYSLQLNMLSAYWAGGQA
ncbi:MAG: hypothetical protein ABIQ90_05595 [Polaromonas sp.]